MKVAKKNVVVRGGMVYVHHTKTGRTWRFNHAPASNAEALAEKVRAKGEINLAHWLEVKGPEPVKAVRPTIECKRCGGTGVYKTFGVCFRCQGKGHQDDADQRRNWGYVQHH